MSDEKKPDETSTPDHSDLEAIAKENAEKKKKREQERLAANKKVLRNYNIRQPN